MVTGDLFVPMIIGRRSPDFFGRKCVYLAGFFRLESLSLRMGTFFVYILQSLKDGSFYVGECEDLDKRMSKHFDGMSKYSASKRPLRLRYFELLPTRSDAIKREKEIKRKKSRKYLEFQLINELV